MAGEADACLVAPPGGLDRAAGRGGRQGAQLLVDGDTSLSDLQYRAQTMSFRTNAASTTVKSTYLDERILRQLSGGGGGGETK